MKNDRKSALNRAWHSRAGLAATQRIRLAQAGYPRFFFRLAAARRVWTETITEPRRHD